MVQKLSPEIKLFKERFREFLENEAALNGKLLVRELLFRFATVQFRDTHGFDETFINSEMKKWLTEISQDLELEKAED